MGEARNKRRRFLEKHPFCCFCGGAEPSTSIDHIPARMCFVGRHYPEGFEFPACDFCQSASRLDELAFAFYVRALDRNPNNFDGPATDKMISGLANNLPHLLPNPFLDGRSKRTTLRNMGLSKPTNILASELPVVEIDTELHQRIGRYGRKIICALYYREQGRIASPEHRVWANWGLYVDRNFMKASEGFINMTPLITVGKRSNTDIGDQFIYRCNKCDDPDILAVIAGFGQGVVLQLFAADSETSKKIEILDETVNNPDFPLWTLVADNYAHR